MNGAEGARVGKRLGMFVEDGQECRREKRMGARIESALLLPLRFPIFSLLRLRKNECCMPMIELRKPVYEVASFFSLSPRRCSGEGASGTGPQRLLSRSHVG